MSHVTMGFYRTLSALSVRRCHLARHGAILDSGKLPPLVQRFTLNNYFDIARVQGWKFRGVIPSKKMRPKTKRSLFIIFATKRMSETATPPFNVVYHTKAMHIDTIETHSPFTGPILLKIGLQVSIYFLVLHRILSYSNSNFFASQFLFYGKCWLQICLVFNIFIFMAFILQLWKLYTILIGHTLFWVHLQFNLHTHFRYLQISSNYNLVPNLAI